MFQSLSFLITPGSIFSELTHPNPNTLCFFYSDNRHASIASDLFTYVQWQLAMRNNILMVPSSITENGIRGVQLQFFNPTLAFSEISAGNLFPEYFFNQARAENSARDVDEKLLQEITDSIQYFQQDPLLRQQQVNASINNRWFITRWPVKILRHLRIWGEYDTTTPFIAADDLTCLKLQDQRQQATSTTQIPGTTATLQQALQSSPTTNFTNSGYVGQQNSCFVLPGGPFPALPSHSVTSNTTTSSLPDNNFMLAAGALLLSATLLFLCCRRNHSVSKRATSDFKKL